MSHRHKQGVKNLLGGTSPFLTLRMSVTEKKVFQSHTETMQHK